VAGYFETLLSRGNLRDGDREEVLNQLVTFAHTSEIQRLLTLESQIKRPALRASWRYGRWGSFIRGDSRCVVVLRSGGR